MRSNGLPLPRRQARRAALGPRATAALARSPRHRGGGRSTSCLLPPLCASSSDWLQRCAHLFCARKSKVEPWHFCGQSGKEREYLLSVIFFSPFIDDACLRLKVITKFKVSCFPNYPYWIHKFGLEFLCPFKPLPYHTVSEMQLVHKECNYTHLSKRFPPPLFTRLLIPSPLLLSCWQHNTLKSTERRTFCMPHGKQETKQSWAKGNSRMFLLPLSTDFTKWSS